MDASYLEWKGWDLNAFGRFGAPEERYFGWHAARALPHRPERLRILEIGFGNGAFMGWARAHRHEVDGVELDPRLVEAARRAGFIAVADAAQLDAASRYDLIVALDVIEHVAQDRLPAFLCDLAARLAEGGRILLRFPNGESPLGRLPQYGDLTHLTVLGRSRIDQLCALCGLEVAACGDLLPWHTWPGALKIPALLREGVRAAVEHLVGRLYFNRRVCLAPNELVVLAKSASA